MPRLIDADALKDLICANVYPIRDAFNSTDYGMFWTGGIEKAIDKMPTVDAVEVIRCKDCEYYSKGMPDEPTICELTMCGANDEGFCAWAERKRDAKEE